MPRYWAASATTELRSRSECAAFEAESNAFVEASLVKALFPDDNLRRRFLRAVGRNTAMAAIGRLMRMIDRQPIVSTSQPPSGGPSAVVSAPAAAQVPIADPRASPR